VRVGDGEEGSRLHNAEGAAEGGREGVPGEALEGKAATAELLRAELGRRRQETEAGATGGGELPCSDVRRDAFAGEGGDEASETLLQTRKVLGPLDRTTADKFQPGGRGANHDVELDIEDGGASRGKIVLT